MSAKYPDSILGSIQDANYPITIFWDKELNEWIPTFFDLMLEPDDLLDLAENLIRIAKQPDFIAQYNKPIEDEYEREARLHEEAAFRAQQEKLTTKLNGSKGKTKMVNNIELPPKGNSIEVEVYELPEEMKEGECDCGPNEACPKCMDKKDL